MASGSSLDSNFAVSSFIVSYSTSFVAFSAVSNTSDTTESRLETIDVSGTDDKPFTCPEPVVVVGGGGGENDDRTDELALFGTYGVGTTGGGDDGNALADIDFSRFVCDGAIRLGAWAAVAETTLG